MGTGSLPPAIPDKIRIDFEVLGDIEKQLSDAKEALIFYRGNWDKAVEEAKAWKLKKKEEDS